MELKRQSYKFICCLLVLSHAGFQLRGVIDFISLLMQNNWWSPSFYQSLHPVWGQQHPPPFTSQSCYMFWASKFTLSESRLSGDRRGKWAWGGTQTYNPENGRKKNNYFKYWEKDRSDGVNLSESDGLLPDTHTYYHLSLSHGPDWSSHQVFTKSPPWTPTSSALCQGWDVRLSSFEDHYPCHMLL